MGNSEYKNLIVINMVALLLILIIGGIAFTVVNAMSFNMNPYEVKELESEGDLDVTQEVLVYSQGYLTLQMIMQHLEVFAVFLLALSIVFLGILYYIKGEKD